MRNLTEPCKVTRAAILIRLRVRFTFTHQYFHAILQMQQAEIFNHMETIIQKPQAAGRQT